LPHRIISAYGVSLVLSSVVAAWGNQVIDP
jgi:hypothetical protein